MTSRSTWKKFERRVSKKLHGKRNPLSGGNSKHTRGDVIHDLFYVEVKLRKKLSNFFKKAFKETIEETIENAKEEEKDWMVVFKKKYSNRKYIMMDFDKFLNMVNEDELQAGSDNDK